MHYFLSTAQNAELFRRNFERNLSLRAADAAVHALPNADGAKSLPALFNAFMDSMPQDANGWLVFCRENLEFLTSPLPTLEQLDRKCLYGVFGVRHVKNMRYQSFREFVGRLVEDLNERHDENPLLYRYRITGSAFHCGTQVDALSGPCLIMHSSLTRSPEFDGLRFDENLEADLCIDDFCRTAAKRHSIPAKVLKLEFLLHSQAEQCGETAFSVTPTMHTGADAILPVDHVWRTRPAIYHSAVSKMNFNHVSTLAASFMRQKAKVLDIGCAYGDNGQFFRENLNATLWGIEYDAKSIEAARRRDIYTELFHEDLERLCLSDFSRFYRFFTHIFIGDVLEHLRSPRETLKKCMELLEPDGTIIVSLPNIGHAYIIANLMAGEFEYTANGILDQTHLRFFTAKSQAELYAGCGLAVRNAAAAFMIPNEYRQWSMGLDFPEQVYEHILGNKHFMAMQYVCELEKSALDAGQLLRNNLQQIGRAPENNPQGWLQKQASLQTLQSMVSACSRR